jgi:hypothetical protein
MSRPDTERDAAETEHTKSEDTKPDVVAILQRWGDAGAIWRVVRRTPGSLEISLLTCTGGEEVDRLVSSDPALQAFVGERSSNED